MKMSQKETKNNGKLTVDQEEFNGEEYDIVEITEDDYETPHEQVMTPDPDDRDDYEEKLKKSGYDIDWDN